MGVNTRKRINNTPTDRDNKRVKQIGADDDRFQENSSSDEELTNVDSISSVSDDSPVTTGEPVNPLPTFNENVSVGVISDQASTNHTIVLPSNLPAAEDREPNQSSMCNSPKKSPSGDAQRSTKTTGDISSDGIDQPIKTEDDEEFDAIFRARLSDILNYKSDETGCYAISQLPTTKLYWPTPKRTSSDKSDLYHIDGKPARIWIVGEVEVAKFTQGDYNLRRPCLLIKPIQASDCNLAIALMQNKSAPIRSNTDTRDRLWIGKWVAANSVAESRIPPFVDIFDATDKLKRKANLPRIDTTNIQRTDIVLVEAFILRWPLEKGEERNEFYRTKNWKTWRVEYKLDSVYLLKARGREEMEERPGEDVEL